MSVAVQLDIDWGTLDSALQSLCWTEAVATISPAIKYYAGYDIYEDGLPYRRTLPPALIHQLVEVVYSQDPDILVGSEKLLKRTSPNQHLGLLSFFRHMSGPMTRQVGSAKVPVFNQGEIDDINDGAIMAADSCLKQIKRGNDNLQPVPVVHDQSGGNVGGDKKAMVLFELGNIHTLSRRMLEENMRDMGRYIFHQMELHDISGTIQTIARFMDPDTGFVGHNPLRATMCKAMLDARKTIANTAADTARQVSESYWENLGTIMKTMGHHPLLQAHYSWANWCHRLHNIHARPV